MAKHYSPRTPLILGADAATTDATHAELRAAGLSVISVGFDLIYDYVFISDDPDEYAAELYTLLHNLDAAGYDRIVVEMPPDTPEWAGVRDRLMRAASE